MTETLEQRALRIAQETLDQLGWGSAFNPLQYGVTFNDGEQFKRFTDTFARRLLAEQAQQEPVAITLDSPHNNRIRRQVVDKQATAARNETLRRPTGGRKAMTESKTPKTDSLRKLYDLCGVTIPYPYADALQATERELATVGRPCDTCGGRFPNLDPAAECPRCFAEMEQQRAETELAAAYLERDRQVKELSALLWAVDTDNYRVVCNDVGDENWWDARDRVLHAAIGECND